MAVRADSEGSVLTITLDRPETLNAFTRDQHRELAAALERAAGNEVRAVVLTAAGRAFSVGQDLEEVRAEADEDGGGNESRLREGYNPNVLAIQALRKPVIAAVNGVAAGAGLSLAAACDIRVASAKARFVPAFIELGLVPDSGGSYFLSRLLGGARAFEWLASGEHLDAATALEWGLVSAVVEPDEVLTHATTLAERLAAKPGNGVAETKRLLAESTGLSLDEALEREVQAQLTALATPEYDRAMRAFLERSSG